MRSEVERTALRDAASAHAFLEAGLDPDRAIYARFGVVAVPTTFVVGADGIVVSAHPGRSASSRRDADTAVRTALGLEVIETPPPETEEQERARRLRAAAQDLVRRRRHAEAATVLADACALRPDDAGIATDLGDALLACGRGADAQAAYERALALEPDTRAASVGRACALAYGEDRDAAKVAIREALRRPPQDARLHYHQGLVLEKSGDWPAAAKAYREAFERVWSRGE